MCVYVCVSCCKLSPATSPCLLFVVCVFFSHPPPPPPKHRLRRKTAESRSYRHTASSIYAHYAFVVPLELNQPRLISWMQVKGRRSAAAVCLVSSHLFLDNRLHLPVYCRTSRAQPAAVISFMQVKRPPSCCCCCVSSGISSVLGRQSAPSAFTV